MYGTLQEGADVIIAVIITACLFKETYETGSWSCSRGSERANEGCLFDARASFGLAASGVDIHDVQRMVRQKRLVPFRRWPLVPHKWTRAPGVGG